MRRVLALIFVLGCHARPRPAPATPTPPPPTPPPRAAPVVDRSADLARCRDAFAEIAAAAAPANVATIYARGCQDLYRAPACRDVIARLPDLDPAELLATLATTCAKAYCASLDAPRPQLCGPGALPPDAQLPQAWRELDVAILARELGLPRDAPAVEGLARATNALFEPVTVEIPASPPRAPRPELRLVMAVSHDHLTIRFEAQTWQLPTPPRAGDLAPVIAALAVAPHHEDAEIVLEVSGATPYGDVIPVLDALKPAGFTHVAIATTP